MNAFRRHWFWCLLMLGCCASSLLIPRWASAQEGATAKSTFTDLDDEAEAGGYDVSAMITALPVQWSVARQENGDGYYVNLTPQAVSLSVQEKGKKVLLAHRNGSFTASKAEPNVLILQRRANRWNIIWQNRVVLRAEDDRFEEGAVGWNAGAEAVQDARLQPTEAPFFDDDFMRVSEDAAYEQAKPNPRNGMVVRKVKVDETIWSTVAGKWQTTGISENEQAQVAQSANPFAFQSAEKGENVALAGRPFWSDYRLNAAVKPQGATAAGLILYAQDAQNYLAFVWKDSGHVQLQSVVGGKTLVLAGGEYQPFGLNQWYRLECRMHSGLWRVYIDGRQVLRADTGWFGQGRIGVYSQNPTAEKNAVFDDVHVRVMQDVLDDFSHPVPGRWHSVTGKWNWQKAATPLEGAPAMALMGEKDWNNYSIDGSAFLPDDGVLGFILHQNAQGYYLFRVAGSKAKSPAAGTAQLIMKEGNAEKSLAQIKTGSRYDNQTTLWSVASDQGYWRISSGLDKTMLLEAYDETHAAGKPGIYAQQGAGSAPRFDGVLIHFPQLRQVWAKIPELYEDPLQAETMGEWSTPQGAWIPSSPVSAQPTDVAAKDAKTVWNKGLFWGDGDVAFKMPALTKDQKMEILLGDAAKPDDVKSTFTLELSVNGTVLNAQLSQGGAKGTVLAREQTEIADQLEGQTLRISRRGSYIIVRLGEQNPHAFLVYHEVA